MKARFFESKWLMGAIFIAVISFSVRLSALDWGFPAILHSDESNVVRSSLGMRFGDFNPHHFDWPSLYFYINYFVFAGFIKFRVLLQILSSTETMQQTFPFWWGPDLPFYYISRLIASAFLSLNIIAIYFLAKELGLSKKFSFLSSLVFGVGVLTNYFSLYGISDTALTFLITVTAYFCIKILKRGDLSDYVLAGIFAGLTASIKYNGAVMCLLILTAHIIRQKKPDIFNGKLIVSALASILLFFAGTPYALLDWDTFIRTDGSAGALWQFQHMGHGLNWLYHILETTPQNFGWFAAFLGFYSIFMILKSKNKEYIYLLVTYAVLLVYVGSWGIMRAHYSLSLFPFFAILSIIGLAEITKKLDKKTFYLLLVCMLLYPVSNTAAELVKHNNVDTRVSSGKWIEQNIKPGSSILSTYNLTGYFGGHLPFFEYENYKVHRINSGLEVEIPQTNEYYLITIDNKIVNNIEYAEENLIYQIDNDWTTGPEIKIYRLNEYQLDEVIFIVPR